MKYLALAACMLLLASIPASSQMLLRGVGGVAGAAGGTHFVLLVDGVNKILLVDGTDRLLCISC